MVQVSEIVVHPTPPLGGVLRLNEPMTHVYLGSSSSNEHMEGWYLDTSASSHMTGREEAFSVLTVQWEAPCGSSHVRIRVQGQALDSSHRSSEGDISSLGSHSSCNLT
jgi:hypothetical protein